MKFVLTNQQEVLLKNLLKSNQRITIKELADKTGMTYRIVQYNLTAVKSWLDNENIEYRVAPGFGIEINLSDIDRKKLLTHLQKDTGINVVANKQTRIYYELLLLLSNGPIPYNQMKTDNESDIKNYNDINFIITWLDRYNLTLYQEKKRIRYLIGEELSRRIALIHLIRKIIPLQKQFSLVEGFLSIKDLINYIPSFFISYFENLPISNALDYTHKIESLMGVRISAASKIELVFYLAITLFELGEKKGAYLLSYSEKNVTECKELFTARVIIHDIHRKNHIKDIEAEIQILAVMLKIAKWYWTDIREWDNFPANKEANHFSESNGTVFYQESIFCIDELIYACSKKINPLLQTDEQLLLDLVNHIEPIITALYYNVPVSFELLPDVERIYHDIFQVIISEKEIIENVIHAPLPHDLAASITMYFVSALNRFEQSSSSYTPVIVIGDGTNTTTKLLLSRINLIFPSLDIISVYNGFPRNIEAYSRANLILSLLPFDSDDFPELKRNVPIFKVSPFLEYNEIREIQKWKIAFEEKRMFTQYSNRPNPDLIDIVKIEHIIFLQKANDWEEVLKIACQPLMESKCIEIQYYESIIHLTKKYGPYMLLAPGVVLFHASPMDGVNHVCLSIVKLEKEVDFGNNVKIKAALVLGTQPNNVLSNVLIQLNSIFENDSFMKMFQKSTKPIDILRAIWLFMPDSKQKRIDI